MHKNGKNTVLNAPEEKDVYMIYMIYVDIWFSYVSYSFMDPSTLAGA
jgi:hypothetical protein